jgi:DNA-binding GntR family transcriptional regulator
MGEIILAGTARISRRVLADQVHEILTERILDRVYSPDEHLNIDKIARELGVSSSPVREALCRLSAEGLVASSSFIGFAVAPMPDAAWFEELYDYRELVETWAVRIVADLRPGHVLTALHAAVTTLEQGSYGPSFRDFCSANDADEAFHRLVIEATGNRVVAKTYRELNPHLHHARLYLSHPQDIDLVVAEHRAILDAIDRGDGDAAAAAMRSHLKLSRLRLLGGPEELKPATNL